MKMKSTLLPIAIAGIILSSLSAQAQSIILTGTVKDKQDEPFEGLSVSILSNETDQSTKTDNQGKFTFKLPGKGDYQINIDDEIYQTFSLSEPSTERSWTVAKNAGSIKDDQQPFFQISAAQIDSSGYTTLDQILQFSVPGFYATSQSISDGTVFVNPASYHGLGPDQILILVNGKRKHASSLLNVSNTFGRGSVSNDFNNIPISMIKEVEFLKTSASVEYGSDAIAGIVNIILKDGKDLSTMSITAGGYPNRDKWWTGTNLSNETESTLFLNKAFKIGSAGYLQLGGDLTHLGAINRAGYYNGGIFQKEAFNADSTDFGPVDLTDPRRNKFWENTGYTEGITAETGRARLGSASIYANAQYKLGESSEIYAFGGYNLKNGYSTGFYRFPKEPLQLTPQIPSSGFLQNYCPL